MRKFNRPIIIVSRCLEFASCRYDGGRVESDFISVIEPYVNFVKVCPEVEIGMGIPRDPIKIVQQKDKLCLMQPSSGKDYSSKMTKFSKTFVNNLEKVDGFILKRKSPSCGIKDVKLFGKVEKSPITGKTTGFFAREVTKSFPHLAVEDEKRLTNFRIREHFLTKLFTLANFRTVCSRKSIKSLIKFHSRNKYLFMAYNQSALKQADKLLVNHTDESIDKIIIDYSSLLHKIFSNPPKVSSGVNSLKHLFGYFKTDLKATEKKQFLNLLEKYRNKKATLINVTSLLKSRAVKYELEYILGQTIFEPYPEKLNVIDDSGKIRDLLQQRINL